MSWTGSGSKRCSTVLLLHNQNCAPQYTTGEHSMLLLHHLLCLWKTDCLARQVTHLQHELVIRPLDRQQVSQVLQLQRQNITAQQSAAQHSTQVTRTTAMTENGYKPVM